MKDRIATTAQIILSQIGGRQFAMMTGSHQFMAADDRLHMKLRRNASGANYLTIKLTCMDDYTMTFKSIRAGKIKIKKEVKGVYCDQLASTFEDITKLYTKLY